jgi:[ribosomal protein S5]-alanine N-acetyltransferase
MIFTNRLQLVPAGARLLRAALEGKDILGQALRARVPATWPPQYLDRGPLEYVLERLEQGPEQEGWWLHFILLTRSIAGRILVGSAGYKGPPGPDGTVEVGYGVVSDHQRQGFASEATRGLVAHAFAQPAVRRVIAETYPDMTPSIGVLTKCGFHYIGAGSEPGVIRYERKRA